MSEEISLEMQKSFFRPVCNESEIDRVFNVKNAQDYLLKIRAETIVDHMRLFRVYRNKALAKGVNWSLEDSFCGYHFIHFKNSLSEDNRNKCKKITYGNVFSNEPEGVIFNTDFGVISTISESLTYFLEFMNLGIMNFGDLVPKYVQMNAIRIALRVMLQTEALDFLMDPRGIIPHSIQKEIHKTVPFQMQFIAGHEYSHFLLNHLTPHNKKNSFLIRKIFASQEDYKPIESFNISQMQEFDADSASINLPQYSSPDKRFLLENSLLWFAYLDIYQAVEQTICPSMGVPSHPMARDRYFHLIESTKPDNGFDKQYWENELPKAVDALKKIFVEDISVNTEFYEMYGSAYLDKPNTQWRGKELFDRVDYY